MADVLLNYPENSLDARLNGTRTKKTSNISMSSLESGVCQLVGDKDQDRFVVLAGDENKPDYVGIFDGHGQTALAADICEKYLLDAILDIDSEIMNAGSEESEAVSLPSGPTVPSDEAIKLAFHKMHDKIVAKATERAELRTGTCAVCLFLGEPSAKDLKAIEETGHATTEVDASEPEQPSEASENENENETGFEDISEEASAITDSSVGRSPSFAKVAWAGDSRCIMVDSNNNIIELSEDHRVSTNPKEVERIEREGKEREIREGLLESEFWAYEKDLAEKSGKKLRPKSYIGQRNFNGVPRGADVLFSYSNGISLQISRTLGDPLAARSATPEPEISTIQLKNDEYCRFVIASDGVWDVFTSKEIVSVLKKYKDAQKAGTVISHMARNKRIGKGLNADDITTVVIDVNKHNRPKKAGLFGRKK